MLVRRGRSGLPNMVHRGLWGQPSADLGSKGVGSPKPLWDVIRACTSWAGGSVSPFQVGGAETNTKTPLEHWSVAGATPACL